jgi:glycosyltransferase A (GT-A) superfamily protein (DUF2064 family)
MTVHFLVLAKAPVPGRVKTRLCPPCTPMQAAAVAAAALRDTFDTVGAAPAVGRTLVGSGELDPPAGWAVVPQRGDGLGGRLANAFSDTARTGVPSLLVGMDTPQVTVDLLAQVVDGLRVADAVLGPAEDGGWWTLALHDPRNADVLRDVPMSTQDTGALTVEALRHRGLVVGFAPSLRDVDTAADARAVADLYPGGHFATAVQEHVPPEHQDWR